VFKEYKEKTIIIALIQASVKICFDLSLLRNNFKFFIGIVFIKGDQMYKSISPSNYHVLHPRPVYLIVSRNKSSSLNVMAASWVSPVSDEPFLITVSIWRGSLTHQYISETREFTINIPSEKHVDIVYKAGTTSGREVDKFKLLG